MQGRHRGFDSVSRLRRALDERGLFARSPSAEPLAGASFRPPQDSACFPQDQRRRCAAALPARLPPSAGVAFPFGRPGCRPALRLALATEWERGTAFLFAPVLLAAGALSYFAVGREPYFLTVAAVGERRWQC